LSERELLRIHQKKIVNIIFISKHHLHFRTAPTYTILFYSSTHDIDFTGGLLHFVDEEIVKPHKGEGSLC
jgi:hypothetical protein